MDMNPMVSVVIPTFNGEKYLEDAILSVFAQTYKDYELIIVDDGSKTREVEKICKKYYDRLKYIRQENRGISAARNNGIVNSNGKYIALLDDDDLWAPEKLEKQVKYYEELKRQGRNVGLIYTGHQVIGEDNEVQSSFLYKSSGYNYKILLFIDFIGTPSSVMVDKAVLDDVGTFDEALARSQDFDLWLRIAEKYEIYSINEFLIKYRNRAGSFSKQPDIKVRCTNLVLGKMLADASLDVGVKNKLVEHHRKVNALRIKNIAYEHLFIKNDGKVFREYIRRGYAIDKRYFGVRVLIYYLFSFISPELCGKIKGLKKEKAKEFIVDVKSLKY
ncbi:MAG: hypothetical protein A3C51_01665 [Omnitrophica bacterium RIFCSPHIGHO2_02_FULL_46_20]|nr:MAG: hypothetical protein A3C51_01665 [Omnitrophica bacterium RIFCSPHIGHO2_02_FULL_46_20]